MILSYVKLALRILSRNPLLMFLNLAGLSIGYAAFFILWPYSQNELKSDQFHRDYAQIARLSRTYESISNTNHTAVLRFTYRFVEVPARIFFSKSSSQEYLRPNKC